MVSNMDKQNQEYLKHILYDLKEHSKIIESPLELAFIECELLYNYIISLLEKIENLTTMTVNGDRTQIKNTAQYKLEVLQQRIDKAIEYIEKHDWRKLENDNTYISPTYLLDILKGEDND